MQSIQNYYKHSWMNYAKPKLLAGRQRHHVIAPSVVSFV